MPKRYETYEALMVKLWPCPYEDCQKHTSSLQGMKKHLVKMHDHHPMEWG